MSGIAPVITGRRSAWAVALVGVLVGLGLLLGVGSAERSPSALDTMPAGYDSTLGEELLEELPEEGDGTAVILFTVDGQEILAQLGDLARVMGELTGGEDFPLVPAEDGTAAFSALDLGTTSAGDARDAVAQLRADLGAAVPDGVEARVTGPAGIQADLASVLDGADVTLLVVTASIVALLLVLTYRSPILWVVPLSVIALTDRVAVILATHVLGGSGIPWDESTLGILSVLVFGAGTGYALLLISRYRDELRRRASRHQAMAVALRRAAEVIVVSAGTVAVGVLCLLLSVFPTTRGLGLACAVGILVAMSAVLVVLPAVLVLFGRWIFWPVVPREGQVVLAGSHSFWRRIGDAVARAPAAYIAAVLGVLLLMATGLTQVRSGLSLEDQFLDTPEAITAAERLGESFPAGLTDPVLVVTRTDDEAGLVGLAEQLGQLNGVTQASPGPVEEGIGQIQVVLEADGGTPEARATVSGLRAELAGLGDTHVTGGEASAVDEEDGAVRDRWVVMPVILLTVMLSLMALLRSVLGPVILISTVLATYASALGISWWLFTGVLGFSAIGSTLPLLAFVFLVALGIQATIFLITRTLEEAKVHGTREGVLRALGATGGVLTSAGILLAAVFAVLGVLPLVVLAQMGVVVCIAVLLDTLLVRTVVVPAVVRLLGERFWWPRRVDPAP